MLAQKTNNAKEREVIEMIVKLESIVTPFSSFLSTVLELKTTVSELALGRFSIFEGEDRDGRDFKGLCEEIG